MADSYSIDLNLPSGEGTPSTDTGVSGGGGGGSVGGGSTGSAPPPAVLFNNTDLSRYLSQVTGSPYGDFSSYSGFISGILPYISTSSPYYAYIADPYKKKWFSSKSAARAWNEGEDAAIKQGYSDYWNAAHPQDLSQLGLASIDPGIPVPADENALLGEYGKAYDGISFNANPYAGLLGDTSAYNKWLEDSRTAYDAALAARDNLDFSKGIPQVAMPAGAPGAGATLGNELAEAFGQTFGSSIGDSTYRNMTGGDPKLLPYNPLKSDWNGNVQLGGLLQGLFQSLFAPDKVPPAELLTSPAFEYKGGLMKGDRPGMDSEGAGLQDLFPWQRTDYSDMMADYDTPNAPSEPRKQTEAPSRAAEQVLTSDPTVRKELEKKMAQDAFVEQRKQQQEALYKQKPNVAIQTDQNARPKQTFNPTQQQVNLGWKAWA